MQTAGGTGLVPCGACGNAVSPMAASCPRCGHPIAQQHAPPPYAQQGYGYPQQRPYTPAQAEMKSASTQVALWGLGIAGGFFALCVVVGLLSKC